MADEIATIGNSTIQHGPENDRVYLIRLDDVDMPELLQTIDRLAAEKNYGKIFAKVPARWLNRFVEAGYDSEALVPYFFDGREDCHFMAKYFDRHRGRETDRGEIDQVISLARKARHTKSNQPPTEYTVRRCQVEDCREMAALFDRIFKSYPFPVEDPAYLDRTMEENVIYYGVWDNSGRLAALASSEMDPLAGSVEMTDFATAPSHRRKGLARYLLKVMEKKMRERGMAVAYTIARAKSVGMNMTFAGAGYSFGGTLIRNTQICGKLESMNVWHKELAVQG